ncbi:MAG: hypothetical protein QXG12_08290 [Thermoproteota archaeon]
MGEKKVVGRNVAITLGIICIVLTVSLVGAVVNKDLQIASLQNRVSTLISEVLRLNSTVSNQKAQISNLEANLSEAKAQISNYEEQISTLQSEKSKLESALAEAQSTVSNYESQITWLRSQIAALQSQVSTLRSRLDKILGITVIQHYEWVYRRGLWSERYQWDLPIPLSLYVEYRERPRPTSWSGYVSMAKDPDDDYYIDRMIKEINTAALREGFTELEKVNFVIAFVQSLPYTEDDVTTPWDEYPRYPIETLFDRGGDCEDTSILVAALLDRMGYDVALLILPYEKHVAVGVSITGAYGNYYRYDGKKYFYLETTGEGWEIGEMPSFKDTRAYVYPLNP